MKKNFTVQYIVRTGLLLAIALVFQIGVNPLGQWVVGPLVNFSLLISAALVGTLGGIIVGCFTPLIALLVGIVKLPPLVPFIMVGNAILVILFNLIRKKIPNIGNSAGIIVAALGKFAFLAISIRYLVVFFLPKVPKPLITVFTLPQLYTALVGGVLALITIKLLPKSMFLNKDK